MGDLLYWIIIGIVVGAPAAILWSQYDMSRRREEARKKLLEIVNTSRVQENRPPMPHDNDGRLL